MQRSFAASWKRLVVVILVHNTTTSVASNFILKMRKQLIEIDNRLINRPAIVFRLEEVRKQMNLILVIFVLFYVE